MAMLMLAAQALFLWMFFSTQAVERLVESGALHADKAAAYRYAAEWRHGLTGGWPLFVPGFFAVAAATWFWALGRPLRVLLPRLVAHTLAAALIALALSGAGCGIVLRDFLGEAGVACAPAEAWPSAKGVAVALYTLTAWNAVILAANRALWWRSLWPLAVPAGMDTVLIVIRPFTFADLVNTWWARTANGDPIALLSLAAVPLLAIWMAIRQLAWERGRRRSRWRCALQGHTLDYAGACPCGVSLATEGEQPIRVWHNLRCFLGRHRYRFISTRDGHNEYVCVRCGHPLLIRSSTDVLPRNAIFGKAVHYPCGLTGHRVHIVAERSGGTEYACDCGHSFLLHGGAVRKVRHPGACVLRGHWLTFLEKHGDYAEYLCRDCGHPFLFLARDSSTSRAHGGSSTAVGATRRISS